VTGLNTLYVGPYAAITMIHGDHNSSWNGFIVLNAELWPSVTETKPSSSAITAAVPYIRRLGSAIDFDQCLTRIKKHRYAY